MLPSVPLLCQKLYFLVKRFLVKVSHMIWRRQRPQGAGRHFLVSGSIIPRTCQLLLQVHPKFQLYHGAHYQSYEEKNSNDPQSQMRLSTKLNSSLPRLLAWPYLILTSCSKWSVMHLNQVQVLSLVKIRGHFLFLVRNYQMQPCNIIPMMWNSMRWCRPCNFGATIRHLRSLSYFLTMRLLKNSTASIN